MPPRKRYFPRKPLPAPVPAAPDRRDLDAVRDIVHASVSGEPVEETLQFALDRVAPLLGATLGSVYLLDGASELMRLVAAYEWPAKYRPWLGAMRVRVGFGPSGEAASERRVIDVPDIFADPDLEDWHDVGRELGFAAITALPLVANGRVLGVATLYFRETAAISAEARMLLRLVADLLASAVDQAARRDELRHVSAALADATSEVERQYAEVGSARRARDDFLEGVSSELRTPLNALLGDLARLEREASGPLTDGQRDELRAVRAAAARVLDLVEALLDFSSARRGTLALGVDEFDPRVPVREAVRDLGAASVAGVAVTTVEPVLALPPMKGDRRKIVRLLVTLVGYAIQHAGTDQVELSVDTVDDRVRFHVLETGTPRLRDDVDVAQPSGSADDLQLSWALDLARTVARLMGGSVAAEAAADARAAFLLDLPVNGPPDAAVARG